MCEHIAQKPDAVPGISGKAGSASRPRPETPNLPHPRRPAGRDMHIGATKTRSADGKPARSHRLVRSEREGDRGRQRTLPTLGTDHDVPREHRREVADLAETLSHGRPPGIRAAAESIVAKLRARGLRADGRRSRRATSPPSTSTPSSTGTRARRVATGCASRPPTISATPPFSTASGSRAATGASPGRWSSRGRSTPPAGARPAAGSGTTARRPGFLELEGDDRALSRKAPYRVRRDDCPPVTLAPALDGAGFPRSAEILPGNASGPDTLRDALERLEAECGSSGAGPVAVIDAGIADEASIAGLNARGCNWTAVSRGGKPPPPEGAPGTVPVTAAEHEVRAWRLAEEGGEARLHVVGEGGKATGDSSLARRRSRFEAALDALHHGLSIKGRIKRRDRILESVGRLEERFPGVSGHHGIRVEKAPTGANARALRHSRGKARADADERAGACVPRTSHTDRNVETVLRTCWRMTDIEATFRSPKSELGLRPVHHRPDRRIAARLMIAASPFTGCG